MVDNELGITFLPRLAVEAGILSGTGISLAGMEGRPAKRAIGLVWRRGSSRDGDFRLLARFMARFAVEPIRAPTPEGAAA
jgi:LysR family hydrogen peroxide-inducible transcriptional activator